MALHPAGSEPLCSQWAVYAARGTAEGFGVPLFGFYTRRFVSGAGGGQEEGRSKQGIKITLSRAAWAAPVLPTEQTPGFWPGPGQHLPTGLAPRPPQLTAHLGRAGSHRGCRKGLKGGTCRGTLAPHPSSD